MPSIAASACSDLIEGSRVSVHTLGCKLNFAETSTIASSFIEGGFTLVPFDRETDVFVLNTCSVTENA
ncbi:MAG TPA: tRNA (N(6)-L-threonylcarbamoyladenosine(37)-C(2))-methylthiotransferase MtaB, partial [Candidatus Kapabacteria bacterium]|nr:tRNA (N(6)-L-threonylcarbamoyladenosine(37)-C(2))-methylthiotransferase MtaB [Candidatus Kapabacteria bacterium]